MRWTHITLPLQNLAASIDFFVDVCGLSLVRDRRLEGGSTVWIGPRPEADREASFVLVGYQGEVKEPIDHLGFQCESRERLLQVAEQARRIGALVEGPTDVGGSVGLFAVVREPSGHLVEFTFGQPLEGLPGQPMPIRA